jgi:hypothetical protein
MTVPSHTPGPWTAVPEQLFEGRAHVAGRLPRVETDLRIIADVRRYHTSVNGRCEVAEADARLIAAAPVMLDALQSILRHIEPQPSALAKAIAATCQSAIHKALGRHSDDRVNDGT